MAKKVALILLLIVLLSAALLFTQSRSGNEVANDQEKIPAISSSSGVPSSPASSPALNPEKVRPTFVELIRAEARALDSTHVNEEETERRIAEEASLMGPAEVQFAQQTALSESAAAGERIMAVFLLSLGGEKSWPALREIILSPLKERTGEAHSIEETKAMQEKAYQHMAVEALAEQAIVSPKARGELARLAGEVRDPQLRQYVQAALKELPAL